MIARAVAGRRRGLHCWGQRWWGDSGLRGGDHVNTDSYVDCLFFIGIFLSVVGIKRRLTMDNSAWSANIGMTPRAPPLESTCYLLISSP